MVAMPLLKPDIVQFKLVDLQLLLHDVFDDKIFYKAEKNMLDKSSDSLIKIIPMSQGW